MDGAVIMTRQREREVEVGVPVVMRSGELVVVEILIGDDRETGIAAGVHEAWLSQPELV